MIRRPVASTLVAWLAMLGVDLLLHAGLLAPVYDWTSPFLLSPQEAFVRIPAGYLVFLVLAAGLVWLLPRIGAQDGRRAARVAVVGGGAIWGALLLGLWSISAAPPLLLVAWWVGQTAELGVGAFLVGRLMEGASLRSVAWTAGGVLALGLAIAVLLQSIGYAPAPVRLN